LIQRGESHELKKAFEGEPPLLLGGSERRLLLRWEKLLKLLVVLVGRLRVEDTAEDDMGEMPFTSTEISNEFPEISSRQSSQLTILSVPSLSSPG